MIGASSSSQTGVGGGLSTGAIAGIVGGILGIFLLLCIVIICVLIKRRKVAAELSKNIDGPTEAKEQATVAAGNMETTAAPQEVNGEPQLYTEERDYGGRLRYPNDTVDVGGRLRPE